jgi:NitT/TauT family transport system substrate-binding protein
MKKLLTQFLFIAASIVGAQAGAAELTSINISYQPALYWSVPYYIATEKHWWKDVGLKPNFSTFPAGAPQVAASASKSWDVGGMGSVPALLGAARYNLLTIGITNDESSANLLIASKSSYEKFHKDPKLIKGQRILLTSNSTGDYAVTSCLEKWGLSKSDVHVVNVGQAQIISAISSGNGELAGVWAPNNYTLEEKTGAKTLCTGKEAGAIIPGALVARADYAKEHPELVAKYLAVFVRTVKWMREHRDETVKMMQAFYHQGGVILPDKYLKVEIDTRPMFDLSQQIKILDRSHGASEVDQWMTKIAQFMKSVGTIRSIPDAKSYVDPKYMQMVEKDPKLKAFATSVK